MQTSSDITQLVSLRFDKLVAKCFHQLKLKKIDDNLSVLEKMRLSPWTIFYVNINFSSEEYLVGDFSPTTVYYHLLTNTQVYCADGFECIPRVNLCSPCPLGKYCPAGTVRYNNSALVNICETGKICRTPLEKELCPESYACGFGSTILNSPTTPSCKLYENDVAVYCPEGSALKTKFVFDNICKGGFYCPVDNVTKERQLNVPRAFLLRRDDKTCSLHKRVVDGCLGFQDACGAGSSHQAMTYSKRYN